MTLLIAAHGDDFVVVGADSRGTMVDATGNRIELNTVRKVVQLNRRVSVLLHGDAAAGRYIVEEVRKAPNLTRLDVSAVAKLLWTAGRAQLKELPPSAWKETPRYGLLITGLDKRRAGAIQPRSLGLESGEGFLPRDYEGFAIKGKPMIAMYSFSRNFHSSMNEDALTRLVAQTFYDTMNVDGDVGGEINMAIIDASGTRPVRKEDLKLMIQAWGRPFL